jgi:hypothetical protein
MYLPLKKTTPPRTHSMALPLKELQKSFSNHRRGPFLLFTRHPDSRGLKVPMRASGGGCCARAQKCSRLGFVESSKVTQSSATTSQIHPHPSATTVADRSVLRESSAQTCLPQPLLFCTRAITSEGGLGGLLWKEGGEGWNKVWIAWCKRQAESRKGRLKTKTMNAYRNG